MDYLKITDFGNKDADVFCAAVRIEDTVQSIDRSEDYTLPEYLPDAKKIVSFCASPIIETRYTGNGSLEYSGNIFVKVLYSTESGELACCSFGIPFENRLTSDGISEGVVDFISPEVTASSCRLQNPRKIKMNVKLGCRLEVWKRESFLPELYGATSKDIACLETNPEEYESVNITSVREDDMILEDDITIDKSLPDISQIVYSSIGISFDECRGSRGEVIFRGGAEFVCTFKGSDGKYYSMRRFLPMSETLSSDKASDDSFCACNVFCKSPDIGIREDEFGQMRIIELKENYTLEARIINKKKLFLTSDAYSSRCDVFVEKNDQTIYKCEEKLGSNFSVNESFPLRDVGIGSDDSIVTFEPSGKIQLSGEAGKHGKLAFDGKCKLLVIAKKPDDTLYSTTIDVPFKFESERKFKEGCKYDDNSECRISDMRVRSDGEKLYTDFEVAMASCILSQNKLSLLSSIRLVPSSAPGDADISEMAVCFTSAKDNIWNIAKEYRVSREALAKENTVTGGELPSRLIIPQKR